MRALIDVAYTGIAAVLLHPMRSFVTTSCLLAAIVPYFIGISISQGVQRDAELSIQFGADLYVSAAEFGRSGPVPITSIGQIASMDGVESVTPRIVGPVTLGKRRENAVVVGLPASQLPQSVVCVDGRMFAQGGSAEVVLGSDLANRLGLRVGDRIPPFYRNDSGDRVVKVVGIFQSDLIYWQAHLMFASLETASEIFNQLDRATDLLVRCRPGYEESVRQRIVEEVSFPGWGTAHRTRAHVVMRNRLQSLISSGMLHREGIFNLHFLIAFSVGILAILVTSGIGVAERRREIGILKAMGWQTDEVLIRSCVESCVLSWIAAVVAVLIGYVWLNWLNGIGVAGIFFAHGDVVPGFPIPYRMTPIPVLLSFIVSFGVVMTGSLYSTWRAAIVSPRTAMR